MIIDKKISNTENKYLWLIHFGELKAIVELQ